MSDQELANFSQMWAKAYARRLSLARHIVDELAQEAALGILHAREKFDRTKGDFGPYARTWAQHYMNRHLNKLGGAVGSPTAMIGTVAFVAPESEPTPGTVRDTRETRCLSEESASFNQALSKVNARVALMVEAKIKGATNEEIAQGLGVSREFVRKQILAFATTVVEG